MILKEMENRESAIAKQIENIAVLQMEKDLADPESAIRKALDEMVHLKMQELLDEISALQISASQMQISAFHPHEN